MGILYSKMSVSPGMIEIITRTAWLVRVYPVLMCSATGVPVGSLAGRFPRASACA